MWSSLWNVRVEWSIPDFGDNVIKQNFLWSGNLIEELSCLRKLYFFFLLSVIIKFVSGAHAHGDTKRKMAAVINLVSFELTTIINWFTDIRKLLKTNSDDSKLFNLRLINVF